MRVKAVRLVSDPVKLSSVQICRTPTLEISPAALPWSIAFMPLKIGKM
jgi:hypothetical protein